MPFKIDLSNLIYTALGFLLGLFGSLFLQQVNRRQSKGDFIRGIRAEFKEALPRFAGTYYSICTALGTINRDTLTWTLSMIEDLSKFSGLTKKHLADLSKMTDEQLAIYSASIKEPRPGKHFKKFSFHHLDNKVDMISLFDSDFQNTVLRIRTKIGFLNAEIERSNFFFAKTFEQLAHDNYQIVEKNLDNSYVFIGKLCREIASLMAEFLKKNLL